MPGNNQSRPPPSAFQNQPPNGLVDTSSSSSDSFSSAHTSNTLISNPASRRPSSPSKRNPTPLSNANMPPQMLPPIVNRKMNQQIPPPPAFGRQNLLPTTTQTQTLHLSQPSSLANQDLQPANVNANMPMIGASSTQMDIQQQSDAQVDIDLPPEFAALFHVSYSFTFHLFSMRRAVRISLSLPARLILRFPALRENLLPLFHHYCALFCFLFVPRLRWVRET